MENQEFKKTEDLNEEELDERECNLYEYMQAVYSEFVDELEYRFIQRYRKNSEQFNLIYNLDYDNRIVTIGFSHDNVVIDDIITEFPFDLVKENSKEFYYECGKSEIIAVVAGDLIYGEEDNPFRNKKPDFDSLPKEIICALSKV